MALNKKDMMNTVRDTASSVALDLFEKRNNKDYKLDIKKYGVFAVKTYLYDYFFEEKLEFLQKMVPIENVELKDKIIKVIGMSMIDYVYDMLIKKTPNPLKYIMYNAKIQGLSFASEFVIPVKK